jgi:hypothetical protein
MSRARAASAAEPAPFDPTWPRYSARPFPSYRFVPGLRPHPRRDPDGHSFGVADPHSPPWRPQDWQELELWLYGIDLFNYAYWWESHEQLEALWLAAGRTTTHACFVQGMIKIAAGCLNLWLGKREIARGQAESGAAVLRTTARAEGDPYMGVAAAAFADRVSAWLATPRAAAPLVELVGLRR